MAQSTQLLRRAVILTALPVEYTAVRSHVSGLREETHPQGTVYERGTFIGPGRQWEIGLVEIGAGNATAAAEAERMIAHFQPSVALFVGVAGGLKDVKLGDVVVATKVYGYHNGKAGTEFAPRPDVGQSSYPLLQRARAERRKPGWLARIGNPTPASPPQVFVAPIAAGEQVVASTDAETFQQIRAYYGDALAVEMEGRGFLTAAHANRPVDALVVRGVSDLIEGKSEADRQGWQERASRHASAFAFEILAQLDDRSTAPEASPPSPSIGKVPHEPNPNFIGREALLTELWTELRLAQPADRVRPITGLGGVGKTQVAVQYVSRYGGDYDLVWWLQTEEPATLAADYAALAWRLNLPQRGAPDQREAIAAVCRWLEQHTGWLLVFDDAPDSDALRSYVPAQPKGHVLVTSRNAAWHSRASPLPLGSLDRSDAAAFLLRRAGQDDHATAETLAEALGDLPLALEQAGAYADATGMPLSAYLDLFRTHQRELLRRGGPPPDYPATVATTWEISFRRVQQTCPAAAGLLNLCAFLAPDALPLDLLDVEAGHLPESLGGASADRLALEDAIGALRRYSLVERANDTLSVHRLVQAVIRHRLDQTTRRTWVEAAVGMVNAAFPFDSDDTRTWPICARLLPHALAVTQHAEVLGAEVTTGHLLNQVGIYLQARAQLVEARSVLERAVRIAAAANGTNYPDVAIRLNNLGNVVRSQGDLAGARALYEQALRTTKVALGSDHPQMATCLNNLGGVLQACGDLDGARAVFERALRIDEAVHGPAHPQVGIRLNNLGDVLRVQGDLAGARAAFERTIRIFEVAYGPDHHPYLAAVITNLGNVLWAQKDLTGARMYLERALRIDEATLGSDHPEVATDLNNLGAVVQTQGDSASARVYLERALKITKATLGSDHPAVATRLANLAHVLQAQGDSAEARTCLKQALQILQRSLGESHPDTAVVRRSLDSLGG